MKKDIEVIFHNKGLRSYIEVDLCSACPRQDNKGCCGYYSPVFYPTDIAYLLKSHPDMLDYIFGLSGNTILDASITVNNDIDGASYRCKFHNQDQGCILKQEYRESICRHFVCPGIDWESEPALQKWKTFFEKLNQYEIDLNNKLADLLTSKGLSLRNRHDHQLFFQELLHYFDQETKEPPPFFKNYPNIEACTIVRQINYGSEWPL